MAMIKIKNRSDLIIIPNEMGIRIKDKWLGNSEKKIGKANKNDVLDLGEWAGEYGQISSIEIEKEKRIDDISQENEEKLYKEIEQFRNSSPENKSRNLDKFKTTYFLKNNHTYPTPDILSKAYDIQLNYFIKNPKAIVVPNEEFNSLIK
jgi:hypothetical protein